MKISIVVPTYKRPALLTKCMAALLKQTFDTDDFEIIIVSDGPDHVSHLLTKLIRLEKKKYNIVYLQLPAKGGPAAARNMGWKNAAGELIVFTDDDCIPSENWLEAYWQAYAEANLRDVVFTGKVIVPISEKPTDYEKNIQNLETAEFITANCACSKPALEKAKGFDEDFKMAWREDSALHFDFLNLHIPVTKVYAATVTHPVRKVPWGVSIQEQRKGLYNALLYKKHRALYNRHIAATPPSNYYLMVLALTVGLVALTMEKSIWAVVCFSIWGILSLAFAGKRLQNTRRDVSHIAEMLVSSLIIPFASVFWNLVGAVRFKVFHL